MAEQYIGLVVVAVVLFVALLGMRFLTDEVDDDS